MRIRHLGSSRGDIEYIYDDQSVIDELNAASGANIAHYRYGSDRLLSLNDGGQEQFYHYASLGTTVNLSDASGNNQVAYRVDPFGEITEQEGSSVNRRVFTGHEHDEETGLIYMKARFYDPDVGRFLNQDTYLGESGTPPSLHRYLYAYGNPTVWVDLDGHKPTCFSDTGSCGDNEGYQPTIDRMKRDEPKDYSEADKAQAERNKQSAAESSAHWRRHCKNVCLRQLCVIPPNQECFNSSTHSMEAPYVHNPNHNLTATTQSRI